MTPDSDDSSSGDPPATPASKESQAAGPKRAGKRKTKKQPPSATARSKSKTQSQSKTRSKRQPAKKQPEENASSGRRTGLRQTAHIAQMAFIVVASFFVYAFVATAKEGETRRACTPLCAMSPNYAAVNRKVPEFELKNLANETVKMSDYRGQVVILNIWSKTCPPCLEEMPSLAQLGHSLAGRDDIALVTITTDESARDAEKTLQSILGTEAPFEVLVDSEAEVVGGKFGTKLYPETWFVDPKGIIRARVDGPRDWSKALPLEFAESLRSPLGCDLRIVRGEARGSGAAICEDMGY